MVNISVLKRRMTSVPVRAVQVNVSLSDAYSLESVGKHGFCECRHILFVHDRAIRGSQWRDDSPFTRLLCAAIEAGPQPNGVVRADIYNMVKEAWELTLEWIQLFNSGR